MNILSGITSFFRAPIVMVSSVVGIGYLPVWSRHWSSFIAMLALFFVVGFDPKLNNVDLFLALLNVNQALIAIFACDAMISSCWVLLFAIPCVWLFFNVLDESMDNVVVSSFWGQMLLVSLGAPAIMAICIPVIEAYGSLCDLYNTPSWLKGIGILIVIILVPLMPYRFFEKMDFWPAGFLRARYSRSALSQFICSFVAVIYSLLFFYGTSLIVFGMSLDLARLFLLQIISYTAMHFYNVLVGIIFALGEDGILHNALVDLGLIGAVSKAVGVNTGGGD